MPENKPRIDADTPHSPKYTKYCQPKIIHNITFTDTVQKDQLELSQYRWRHLILLRAEAIMNFCQWTLLNYFLCTFFLLYIKDWKYQAKHNHSL